jgi:hypothetical protein
MSQAERYRAFASEWMRRAERSQNSIERRTALLNMTAAWAETAACLDDLFALRNKFDDGVREARKGLKAAWDRHAQIVQGKSERPNRAGG